MARTRSISHSSVGPPSKLMLCAVLARRYKRQTEKLQAQEETRAAKA
jgi:hypothetical protein